MWIFGRHRHLDLRVLSEYLDGLLSVGERASVSRRLAACALCQEELEGLRATVSLLQGLEDIPIPRSFTLTGPPPAPVAARPQPLAFRAPNWAYASAASLAGLALAVMVSADATGLLTTPPSAILQESFSIAAAPEQPTAATTAEGEADVLPTAKPEIAPAPQADHMRSMAAAQALDEANRQEKTQPPTSEESVQPLTADRVVPALEATSAPQPTPVPGTGGPEGAVGPVGPVGPGGIPAPGDPPSERYATEGDNEDTTRTTIMAGAGEESAATEAVPTSEPSTVLGLGLTQTTQTPLVWRVLEGVAAGIAVLLLVVLALKWRHSRRAAR